MRYIKVLVEFYKCFLPEFYCILKMFELDISAKKNILPRLAMNHYIYK